MPTQQPAGTGWILAGRYRILDRVGSGAMAEVFRAHDELLARQVAVKVFRAHLDAGDSISGRQRQEIELQALARLSHPNLIALFDGAISNPTGPAYMVMELINGPSLYTRISEGPLTEAETRQTGAQIATALAYVHAQGMVHRDVKPANILLGTDATTGDDTVRARLSDFGIVRLIGSERLTSADFMVGTASYLAPEQARGGDVGPPTDVYALGLVLLECLTGHRAFDGPALEAVMARLDHDPPIPTDLPAPWPELLAAMTTRDPARRPTAAQVADVLRGGRPGATAATTVLPAAGALGAAAVGGAALAATATGSASGATDYGAAAAGTAGYAAAGAAGYAAGGPAGAGGSGPPTEPPTRLPATPPPSSGSLGKVAGVLAAIAVLALVFAAAFLFAKHRNAPVTPGTSSSAAPVTSAPRTSAPPSTSAAPSTSASTSAASSTPASSSASPSSSAPSTSAAASTSAPPSTAPASSSAAPTGSANPSETTNGTGSTTGSPATSSVTSSPAAGSTAPAVPVTSTSTPAVGG